MNFKKFLTETDPRRDMVIKNDRRHVVGGLPDRVCVNSQVTRIAHQEERGEVAEHESQPGQSAADADVLFHFFVAGRAECCEILQTIRLVTVQCAFTHKGAEWDLMMHIMLASAFDGAADLTLILVACAHTITYLQPVGAVIV